MTNLSIRTANEQDAEAIALVHISSWQKAYEHYIPDTILTNLSLEERTKQWFDLIHQGTRVLVLETNHQLIGFVSVRDFNEENETLAEISNLYLHPDYWRKNLGTKIYLAAMDELSNMGYKKVLLWVLADNEPARLFYETLGMHTTGETQLKEFYEGGALLTEVLYECSLGAK